MVNTLVRFFLVTAALLLLTEVAQAQCTGQPDANTVCAGPPTGGPGLPFFRSLTPADVPAGQAVEIILQNNSTAINGGQNGRLLVNSNGKLSDFQLGGDCTFTAPNISCTKLTGITFAPSATTDATNAGNIGSGTLPAARLPTGMLVPGTGLAGGTLNWGGTLGVDFATTAQFQSAAASKALQPSTVFTNEVAVTFNASLPLDFNTFVNAVITLTGNVTSVNTTNMKSGQAGMLRFIQDGTGNRTIPVTLSSSFHCPGGCDYVLSTAAASVDAIPYFCVSPSYCIGGPLIKDVR